MSIILHEVSVVLQDRRVLRDISARLTERRIGIIGANGSGKSTFARLLNGLVLPSAGTVRVGALDTRTDTRAVRRRVGFVFQNPDNQIVFPIVSEDLAFGLKNLGLPRGEASARAAAILERLDIAPLAERASHTLSGGEKQMVALAAVLVMRPEVIVLDEPTTLLDLSNRNRIRGIVAGLHQTAVVATHDLAFLADFDRVLVLDEGRLVADDSPAAAIRWYEQRVVE